MNSLQKIHNWMGQPSLAALIIPYFVKIGYFLSLSSGLIYFSAAMLVMPIVGVYVSYGSLVILFTIRFLMSVFLCKTSIFAFFMTHYLAGFGAAVSIRSHHWIINIFIPAICMGLFIMHPIAGQVWVYSLYWLIPMILCVIEYHHLSTHRFLQALRSTFVAHALGSVAWAYCKPMAVHHWQLLLPLVAIERLLLAASIAICCIGIDWIVSRRNSNVLHISNAWVVKS